LLLGVAGAAWYVTKPATAPGAPLLSIVVLPFANVGNDPEQEYFADGITDDLTTDLSRISGSFVIARTTAFTCKRKAGDVKQIGRDLGVRYVLEGSVRRMGEQVQINAQLIDADTGAHIWADPFDGARRNLPELQDEVTSRLARTLNRELIGAAIRRIEQEHRPDPDAQDYTMRGWAVWNRPSSREDHQAALGFFERALEIDGRSIDAMIGLAGILAGDVIDGWSTSPAVDEARADALIRHALDLDPNNAEAHSARGTLLWAQNRLDEAVDACGTAISLNRNNARDIRRMGIMLNFLGRPEEAIPLLEKALRLDPRSPNLTIPLENLGYVLLLGHVDEAIDFLRRSWAANPRPYYVHMHLAGALGLKGDIVDAKQELAESIRLKPEYNTLKRYAAGVPWVSNPKGWALRERTLNAGLRKAGLPEE
jgi:adenylate cyclase